MISIPVAGILNALAVLVFGHPLATTLLMVGIAVMVGLSATRGVHAVAAFASIQPAITVIAAYLTVSLWARHRGAGARR